MILVGQPRVAQSLNFDQNHEPYSSLYRRSLPWKHKRLGTSELIDWVKILSLQEISPERVRSGERHPPFWRTLFKTRPDLEAYEAHPTGRDR